MIYGYARVSTEDQEAGLGAQVASLERAGVPSGNIFIDRMTGTRLDRPEYQRIMMMIEPGDKIVFAKLDRLGRSTVLIIQEIDRLQKAGVDVKFLEPDIDTTTSMGKAMVSIFAVFAQLERDMISDRTKAALSEIARTKKKKDGSPIERLGRPSVVGEDQIIEALKSAGPSEVARRLNIHRSTVYRVKRRNHHQ